MENLLDVLRGAGVRSLLDIRENPVSMYRPELCRSNLKQLVEQHGLHYLHLPQLGVPRDIRVKAIETGSRDVIWKWYDQFVVRPFLSRNIDWLLMEQTIQ